MPRRPRRRARSSTPWRLRLRAALADPVRQLQLSMLLLLGLVGAGTLGYQVLEGWGWLHSLYMTVITVTTVGFGEVAPLDASGRIFTIFLILFGVGIGAWAVSNAIEVMLGQTLWTSVQRRKMKSSLHGLRDHFVVCGFGRLGTRIVRDLTDRGESFVVVDWSAEQEERFLEESIPHLVGDATQDEVLLEAGVERARGLVAALDSDASNVLTVLTARELNPKLLIVARANTEGAESKLRRAGADRVVTPDSIGGHRLALAMLRPTVHDLFNQIFSFGPGGEVDVGQITIPRGSPFAGQTVAGCDLRRVRNINILAIRGADGRFTLNPEAQRVIEPGEVLVVIGPAEAVYEMEAMFGEE